MLSELSIFRPTAEIRGKSGCDLKVDGERTQASSLLRWALPSENWGHRISLPPKSLSVAAASSPHPLLRPQVRVTPSPPPILQDLHVPWTCQARFNLQTLLNHQSQSQAQFNPTTPVLVVVKIRLFTCFLESTTQFSPTILHWKLR